MQEKNMRNVRQLQNDYDNEASDYDRDRFGTDGGQYTDQLEKSLLQRRLRKGTILEVGVATGRFGIFLSGLGFAYVGIDISRGMLQVALAKARVNGRKLDVVQMDAQHMYLRGTFDNVICVRTFHFIPKPSEALYRMKNSLNSNGLCLVTFETDNFLRRTFLRFGLGRSEQRYYRLKDVEKMFQSVGLKVIETGTVLRIPASFYRRCPPTFLPLIKRLDPLWPWPVQEYVLGENNGIDAAAKGTDL